jgi:tetratricopeptide (TPR) repeat protein
MSGQHIAGLIQLGRARAGLGDTSGARDAFGHARRAVESIGDRTRLSSLLMNEVLLLKRENRDVEERITLCRRAWAIATANGSAQIMTESAVIEAHTLATIGEYDGALEALARAERAVRWSGSLLTRLSPQLLRAELAARRGHPDQAADEFERTIALAATDPVVEARIRLVAVATLAFHPPFLARALAHLDQVLAAMAEGRIPRDGTNAHLASEDDTRQMPARVRDMAAAGVPGFLAAPDGVSSDERGLRGTLLQAEYEGDARTVAQTLWRLANGRYDAARPRRMLDLAEAALQAAERAGDETARIAALLLAGIARDLSGNFQGAMDASRAVIDAQPPADEELRIRASQNLGVVLARAAGPPKECR